MLPLFFCIVFSLKSRETTVIEDVSHDKHSIVDSEKLDTEG